MYTTTKENSDSFITIRYAGQFIAIRDNITEAHETITWNHWSIPERVRLAAARGNKSTHGW